MSLFPVSGRWKPSPAIYSFLFVVAGAMVFTLWLPQWWYLSAGIVLIFHFALTIAGLVPRSTLLGPNITRLPDEAALRGEIAITIDDGPNPDVTPRVLDMLDGYQAKATFFCIGRLALKHPELCREIVRRGHAIENHSLSHHWYFSLLGPRGIHREVQGAQAVLKEITGRMPHFFRATAGLRNPMLEPVLVHLGMQLCSWSRRGYDTRVGDADVVLKSLLQDLKGGDILLLHDGNAATTYEGVPVILEVLPRLLENIRQANLHSVTLSAAIP